MEDRKRTALVEYSYSDILKLIKGGIKITPYKITHQR
jgi:hypothetical protein